MKVGRLRIKLAPMLSELFKTEVLPEDMWVQLPAYRVNLSACALWGVTVRYGKNHIVHGSSWNTMTDCVKAKGVSAFRTDNNNWEICAGKGELDE